MTKSIVFYAGLVLMLVLTLGAGPARSAPACANAGLRVGYAAYLPDCRGYELVTPRGSAAPIAPIYLTSFPTQSFPKYSLPEGSEQVQTAIDGDRIAYASEEASQGSPGLIDLATRGPQGWSAQNAIPRQSVETGLCLSKVIIADWSADLSKGVLTDGNNAGFEGAVEPCGRDEPELVAGEPKGIFGNLFWWDSTKGTEPDGYREAYQLINVTPSSVAPAEADFDAASQDLSHVVFNESAQLTGNAPSGDQLYEWSAGKVYLVTVLPDGTAVQGQLAGAVPNEQSTRPPWQTGAFSHAVSADGSRIFFQANGGLYLREHGAQAPAVECVAGDPASTCTVQVDEDQGGTGTSGGGVFGWASVDGSRVFFTDDRRLTADSGAEPGRPDLYEYEIAVAPGAQGKLTDLTSATVNGGEAADVLGVSGASQDGSYVYFVADGVLTTGENSHKDKAVAGQPNLYVSHGGRSYFIATLQANSSDECDWISVCLTARVSSNGEFIAFDSVAQLTGYDNTPAEPSDCEYSLGTPFRAGAPCIEVFRYAAVSGGLGCVSCGPAGVHPVASTTIRTPARTFFWKAANEYLANNVSDSGQVFFDTADALFPAAGNGLSNVYEYEDDGLHLLSSGTSDAAAYFADATPSGGDAFLITEQQLVPQDTGAGYAIYDARVNGGFPFTEATIGCGAEACRAEPSSVPAFQTPGSLSFLGFGNRVHVTGKTHAAGRRLARKRRLKRALRACRKHRKRRARVACERRARRQYGRHRLGVRGAHKKGSK